MLNAKNENTRLSTGDMDYIRFGSGKKTLIIIPGLGDGFATVKGTALPFALGYREAAKDFRYITNLVNCTKSCEFLLR